VLSTESDICKDLAKDGIIDQFAAEKLEKCLSVRPLALDNATSGYKPTSLSENFNIFIVPEKLMCCEWCMFFFYFHMLRGPSLPGWRRGRAQET